MRERLRAVWKTAKKKGSSNVGVVISCIIVLFCLGIGASVIIYNNVFVYPTYTNLIISIVVAIVIALIALVTVIIIAVNYFKKVKELDNSIVSPEVMNDELRDDVPPTSDENAETVISYTTDIDESLKERTPYPPDEGK